MGEKLIIGCVAVHNLMVVANDVRAIVNSSTDGREMVDDGYSKNENDGKRMEISNGQRW